MTPGALAALYAEAAGETAAGGWDEAGFASLLDQPSSILCAAPRGFALGRIIADEAELLLIATHPLEQRQGVARGLLAALESRARARGAARLFLEVAASNAPAHALYLSAGYSPLATREGYYARPDGTREAAVIMAKSLT